MPQVHRRTCSLCEANCGIVIEHDGPKVLSIKGDPDNALSRGHICPKAVALQDLQDDPDRLRRPLRRDGESWTEIGWDEAFREIGERTRAILAADPAAGAIYRGNPNVHNYANVLNSGYLVKALGRAQRYSASSVDQIPVQVAGLRMLGHPNLWGIPDIDRAETVVILGGNPIASNGSLWTVPDVRQRIRDLQARGGKLITIDPRRTETARLADHHLFIRPAGDLFLLIALLKAVLRREPARPRHPLAEGLDLVSAALARWPSEACAAACGIALGEIEALAVRLCQGPAALYGRMGISVQEHGTLNAWLINLINIASGNYDREGGVVFTRPAIDNAAAPNPGIGRHHSRVAGHRDVLGEFPAVALAEEIETPGPGQVRALFVLAGNPTLSVPNGARLARAMAGLELMVSIDLYRNATSRLAHYILPPRGPLERDHFGMLLLPSAVRNFAQYSEAMLPPSPGSLDDWEILRGLAEAITGQPISAPPPPQVLDTLLAAGPWQLSLAEIAAHPSGLDLGPCEGGVLAGRLKTPTGRIVCAPDEFIAALDGLDLPSGAVADGQLYLISRRHVRSNNSWLGNSHRLVKGAERCTLEINPADAAARRLNPGEQAVIANGDRAIHATVSVTDDMMPGCVSLPHGWGHDLPGVSMAVARAHPGTSINDVTDDNRLDPLSGNAALAGVRVTVAALT